VYNSAFQLDAVTLIGRKEKEGIVATSNGVSDKPCVDDILHPPRVLIARFVTTKADSTPGKGLFVFLLSTVALRHRREIF
jgi:hypothetical protein